MGEMSDRKNFDLWLPASLPVSLPPYLRRPSEHSYSCLKLHQGDRREIKMSLFGLWFAFLKVQHRGWGCGRERT